MKNGFFKVAAAMPSVRVADPAYNAQRLIELFHQADEAGVQLVVFPELSLTGYTCADLFYSTALQSGAKAALDDYLAATASSQMLSVVGLPLSVGQSLYNCAAVCQGGRVLGFVPGSHPTLPDEADTARYFTEANENLEIDWNGQAVPFGPGLTFACREMPSLKLGVEIGVDFWSVVPPSVGLAAAGATVICNPTASSEAIGKEARRRLAVEAHSARTVCGYVFASAGEGESTTDAVYGGHRLICENGELLAEGRPFDRTRPLTVSEIDVEKIVGERMRKKRYSAATCARGCTIPFSLPIKKNELTRKISPLPFIPDSVEELSTRCRTVLDIQSAGLQKRMQSAYAKKLVIGISGGLDSTLALLVAVRAIDALKRPRADILAVTMPCFGTTARTKSNATVLCEELGVDFRCVDIFDAVKLHFRDIGHDEANRDTTYENAQARERTQILMDLANDCGGMVIGTGDLSELALGWATYNGDHMSMYGVNASVPKTLVRHLVAFCADQYERDGKASLAAALRDVVDTPVSPELLPADADGSIAQKTEDLVGPYEIHDFYLYYMLRFGFSPEKLYRMSLYAFSDRYDRETLLGWLKVFLRRFFSQQFKRSCLPDGPKVGSVSLSPRTDWHMPSDASANLWINELETL